MRRVLVHLGWIAAVILTPRGVAAQDHSATARDILGILTPHRQPEDTGRMTWGHHVFATYTTPSQCDRAVAHLHQELDRIPAPNGTESPRHRDTLTTAVSALAHACAQQFTLANTDPREWWSLFRLALAMGDDGQAQQIVERHLARASTPEDRAEVLAIAESTYFATPDHPRVALAEALIPRLDSLGARARVARYRGRDFALQYWWKKNSDPDSLRAYADAAATLLRAMSIEERDQVNVPIAFSLLFFLASDQQDLATEETVLLQATPILSVWHEGQGVGVLGTYTTLLQNQKNLYGKPTRALPGTHWFHAGDTPHPAPGVASLIVSVDHTCLNCGDLWTQLRQLHALYGAALDITLITDTKGYAIGTGPLTPDEEATVVSHYVLDVLRLPGALLVDESPTKKRSDGHIIRSPAPLGKMFGGWNATTNAILVDRAGKVQWLGRVQGTQTHRTVMAILRRVVGAPHTGSPAVSP